MKKILATLVIAGAAFGISTGAFAQQAGPTNPPATGSQQTAHPKLEELQKQIIAKLGLTKDQMSKLKLEDKNMKAEAKKIRADSKANPANKKDDRKKMQALRKSHEEALKGIFTPDQQEKYKSMMKDAIAKVRADRAKNKGATPPPTSSGKGGSGSGL